MHNRLQWLAWHFAEIYRPLDILVDKSNYRNIIAPNDLEAEIDLLHARVCREDPLVCVVEYQIHQLVVAYK